MIAIYDERTQRQVEGAEVAATVTPFGLGPPPIVQAPTALHVRLKVSIHVPGQSRTTEVQFNYSHPR